MYGLENSLPIADRAAKTPFVANLNASRNSFPRYVPCPLVLWVPEYVLTAILHGAPDFFSVRSGVYHFAAKQNEMQSVIETIIATDEPTTASLSADEKLERIQAIQTLLEDYQRLPNDRQNLITQFRLLLRLAYLHTLLAHWHQSITLYHRAQKICQDLNNDVGESIVLNNLGSVYIRVGDYDPALVCFKSSMEIKQKTNAGDVSLAQTEVNIASVYAHLEKFSEAEAIFNHALQVFQHANQKSSVLAVMGNLAGICLAQQRWAEAEFYITEALKAASSMEDVATTTQLLSNLGTLYTAQGRWSEAEKAYQNSIAVKLQLGDLVGYGIVLSNLALLKSRQGDFEQALKLQKEALTICRNTEQEMEVQKAQQRIADWERRLETTPFAA